MIIEKVTGNNGQMHFEVQVYEGAKCLMISNNVMHILESLIAAECTLNNVKGYLFILL